MPLDKSLLQAALVGYQLQYDVISARVAEIKRRLGSGSKVTPTRDQPTIKRGRTLSAAAKKSISDAQKQRWAEYRKAQHG
jgi:hypothetical protein